jgi:hypothetical protein
LEIIPATRVSDVLNAALETEVTQPLPVQNLDNLNSDGTRQRSEQDVSEQLIAKES